MVAIVPSSTWAVGNSVHSRAKVTFAARERTFLKSIEQLSLPCFKISVGNTV